MPKAIRILVYEGSQDWLDRTLENSYINVGRPLVLLEKPLSKGFNIKEILRRTYDEGKEPKYIDTKLGALIEKPEQVLISITEVTTKYKKGGPK